MKNRVHFGLPILAAALAAGASDWPQFMRTSEHTGDAADEELKLPLGLVAQVKLEDAIMTSPAVVGGLVYVVDQMGTAYCFEPKAGKIVWKAAPDGEHAMGSNTSSPCVAKGRMYYGTTAGTFHILDCQDGKVVRTVTVGMPVISSPTFANESVYFQALDAVVRCLDLDGNEKWTWEHYKRYQEPPEITKAEASRRGHPGGQDRPQYGGGDVTVSGDKVVTSVGWDLLCLEDKGKAAELAWCRRAPVMHFCNPMSSSISGEWVYTCGMTMDFLLAMMRTSLKDGADVFCNGRNAKAGKSNFGDPAPKESVPGYPGAWTTAAVRGSLVTTTLGCGQIQVFDVGKAVTTTLWRDEQGATPIVSSYALAKEHLVATTLLGQALILDLAPTAGGRRTPFVFKTASGKGIGSSPAISDGSVYFGADDGCLYVLGPGGALEPRGEEKPRVAESRSKVLPATGKAYGWVSVAGNSEGTNFIDDPELEPPFRVRWATRVFGYSKTPAVATEDGDVISMTAQRIVTCQEQTTGRMRWRSRVPFDAGEWTSSVSPLAAEGRVYVPVPNQHPRQHKGAFYCLDQKTGKALWTAEIGGILGHDHGLYARPSPVLAAGKVAFAHSLKDGKEGSPVVQAWDAATGAPAWTVELKAAAGISFGVTDGKNFYFSLGSQYHGDRPKDRPAETVAIEAATGKVLWRTGEFASGLSIGLKDGKLYLYDKSLVCLSACDGTLVWQGARAGARYLSIGEDYLVMRGYGGQAERFALVDGQSAPFAKRSTNLGGDCHACGAVALTPNLSINVTVAGLHVRDTKTGELLWLSPGFAPRGCDNPSLANGRVFWPSAASGVTFCWEPEK